MAINPISAGISVLPSPPARGRSLSRTTAGRSLVTPLARPQGVASPGPQGLARVRVARGIRLRLAKQRISSDFPPIVCFDKVRFRTFSLERSPGVHVQPVDGHQLKMPPLAVIGASTQYREGKAAPMGVLRASKVGPDSALRLIAKRLREESEDITQEPLSGRLRELVRDLDRCAAKENASLKMGVLEELLSTREPTAKTRALLEAFRRHLNEEERKRSTDAQAETDR